MGDLIYVDTNKQKTKHLKLVTLLYSTYNKVVELCEEYL